MQSHDLQIWCIVVDQTTEYTTDVQLHLNLLKHNAAY